MPFKWYETEGRYRDDRGRWIPKGEVRKALDQTLDALKRESDALAERLQAGTLDLADWHQAMRGIVKRTHAIAHMAAVGGKRRMNASEYGQLGARVKAQYQWLNNFRREIADGTASLESVAARARLYVQAGTHTYEAKSTDVAQAVGYTEMRRQLNAARSCDDCIGYAAAGWVPIGSLPNPGEACACVSGCKCTVEYRRVERDGPAGPGPRAPRGAPPPRRSPATTPPPSRPRPRSRPATPRPPHTDPNLKAHRDHLRYVRDEVHAPEVTRYAVEAGTTPRRWREQMTGQLQAAVDQGAFYTRVPADVMPDLLRDGRWKTQHETAGSRGAYDPAGRAQVEAQLFGTRPATAPRDRPVYGYVAEPGFATVAKPAEQGVVSSYGEVVVRLNESVRDRTTITVGDSLARFDSLAGAPARQVTADALPVDRSDFRAIASRLYQAKPEEALGILERGVSYIEAQYHGGLRLADIDEIAFPSRPSRAVRDILAREKIAWRVMRTEPR